MLTETLTLPNGWWLVATADRYWLSPDVGGGGVGLHRQAGGHHVQPVGDSDITRQLFAGCLQAGAQEAVKTAVPAAAAAVVVAAASASSSPLMAYVYLLAGMYQTTHATPAAMRHAAQTFTQQQLTGLAHRCLEVADEETGHDELALADLRALGFDADALVQRLQPAVPMAMTELFWRYATKPYPIEVFGYAYALERSALQQKREHIQAIEAQLPAGVHATRCLRVHSAEGSDASHVPESLAFMAGLSASDRAAIGLAVYETAKTMYSPVAYPGDEALSAVVRACQVQPVLS
jgi:pyrroloquinoline quinone (PQQ) biosynthesis protein C